MTVDNDHTYFVTGSDSTYGVWVHNDCWSSLPDGAELSGKTLPNGSKLYQYKEDGKIKLLYQGKDGRYYDKNVYKPDDLKAQQGGKSVDSNDSINDGRTAGNNRNQYTNAEASNNAIKYGYKVNQKDGITYYYNKNGNPKYLVKSTTGHVNEMYKGFDDLSKAIKSAAKSSSQAKDRTGTYDINLKRINK